MKAGTAVHVAVRDALADLARGDVVLVACSGGPDSLALAAATAGLAERYGWLAGAVVVDHGWSAEAGAAGRQAALTCRELGLGPVDVVVVDSSGPGGPEAAARTARYLALDAAADRFGAVAVLLGHTLDDQAETVLLGLGRGSGARSLAGMAATTGRYRRPFLGLTRETTVAACAELGLEPWLDPANDDPAYTRVRVRRLAAELEEALGPGVAQALARTADLLRDDADALDAAAAALVLEARVATLHDHEIEDGAEPTAPEARGSAVPAVGGFGSGELDAEDRLSGEELDAGVLAGAPAAVRRRALLAAARAAGCPAGSLGHRHVLALDGLLTAAPGTAIDLPGRLRAELVAPPTGTRRRARTDAASGSEGRNAAEEAEGADERAAGRGERARRLLIRYGPNGRPGMGNLPPSPEPESPS